MGEVLVAHLRTSFKTAVRYGREDWSDNAGKHVFAITESSSWCTLSWMLGWTSITSIKVSRAAEVVSNPAKQQREELGMKYTQEIRTRTAIYLLSNALDAIQGEFLVRMFALKGHVVWEERLKRSTVILHWTLLAVVLLGENANTTKDFKVAA